MELARSVVNPIIRKQRASVDRMDTRFAERAERKPKAANGSRRRIDKMAARAECKFCGRTVGVSKIGKIYAHGFNKADKITRLDNLCEGSGMHVNEAAAEPVNDVRPCVDCGLPVVFAMGDLKPDEVRCPICIMPKDA
jgi:hypothetical protein